jgi:hypothetical protein
MKLRCILLAALAASPLAGAAPADMPARVARLAYVEGQISFQEAGQPPRWTLPDRPFLPDDRLTTKPDARAEIALGTASVRLDEGTTLDVEALDADRVRLRLEEGVAVVTLRELADGEAFEIATSNTTISLVMPGEYRVEAPTEGVSTVTVHGGAAEAETAGGPVRIADGQRVRLEGTQALATLETARPADAFDEWVLQREVQLADNEPSSNMDEPVLDQYGEWQDDPTYGRVWMPGYAYGGYDPFGYGSWQRVGFGWSWVDPYPWSPYTFYGGRWVHVHNRWCWTPPRPRPPVVALETHPFGRPRGGKGTVMPVDRELPNATARAPSASEPNEPSRVTPRVTPSKPRSGTFIPIQPRSPSQPQPMTAPSSHGGGGTMRPSTSSGSSSSSSSSSNSSSSSSSNSPSRPSTMSSRPSRESGATSEP